MLKNTKHIICIPVTRTAHKLKQIVNMNADISGTIIVRELGFQI